MKNATHFDFYKKKNFLVYFSSLIVILILITIVYFSYFHKKADVAPVSQIQRSLIDTRFLVLYGEVSKIGKAFVNIEIRKDSKLTDYVFDDAGNIKVVVGPSLIIKGFDVDKKVYRDLKISDIKIGDFITVYIDNATSSGYKAMGIKVFSENIIK
ncbi:MAG: hypothetical protein WC229_03025 [Candidatus Paceibacterota bacterium]|jgi:hypothetical protein